MLNDLFDVLHGRDQVVLNAMPPEAPMTGALEVVVLRRLSKNAFDEYSVDGDLAWLRGGRLGPNRAGAVRNRQDERFGTVFKHELDLRNGSHAGL
jgi:hypothetical protein